MKILAILLALFYQGQPAGPLTTVRTTLRGLAAQLDEHRPTFGATADLTAAKHQLRDWIESELAGQNPQIDSGAFSQKLRAALGDADLLCNDCTVSVNYLGYVDDVRVMRRGDFLVVVTATGISCGYDESAYAYAWSGQQWRRVWEHEQNTYTAEGYVPQQIQDIQISSVGADGERLLMLLGSQTLCGGAFKNLYARAWQIDSNNTFKAVLNWTGYGDDGYPPLTGRVLPDDVLFEYTAGGAISGEVHTAVRHFKVGQGAAAQVDPIAGRPHDFVLEWLAAPWQESRLRSDSVSLETAYTQLRRPDAAGDFPDSTLRCTGGEDLWQVATNLYERPKRYFRVRRQSPLKFTMVSISETPYPDCTVKDDRGETYPDLLSNGSR
ncbi:MAG TPA: hypothetical protein VGK48_04730 [Terriglobia bacterium]